MVWNNDKVPNPNIPSPENYAWKMEERQRRVAACDDDNSTSSRGKCGCVKQRCSTKCRKCQCRKAGLTCTELWAYSNDDEPCENALQEDDSDEYIDDNDKSENRYDSASDDDEDD